MSDIFFGLAIIFIASFIQGITGFGFALIAAPLLSYFFPIKTIVPLIVLYSLITNFFILQETRKYIRLKEIQMITIFGVIGIPIGVYFLKYGNVKALKILIGLIIIITALSMLRGYKIKIKNVQLSSGIVGLLSGFLNGSVSMSGPPVVLFLTNNDSEKNVFRANLTAYAIITNLITVGSFVVSGIMTKEIIKNFIYFAPGLVIGIIIGTIAVRRINEKLFKKIILILILIMGVTTVVTTIR